MKTNQQKISLWRRKPKRWTHEEMQEYIRKALADKYTQKAVTEGNALLSMAQNDPTAVKKWYGL